MLEKDAAVVLTSEKKGEIPFAQEDIRLYGSKQSWNIFNIWISTITEGYQNTIKKCGSFSSWPKRL
jgi:hypothetical protein